MKSVFRHLLFLPVAGIAIAACGDNNKGTADAPPKIDSRSIDAAPTPDAPPATPSAVTNFTAAPGVPKEIALQWTNPTTATLNGIVIVASKAAITFAPVDGTSYTVAQSVGTDQTVVSIAKVTAATFTPAVVGQTYRFAAWAFNAQRKYSPIALASGVNNALGTQSATISVNLTNNALTIGTQAPDVNIEAASTATYVAATKVLTINVTIRNKTARLLFNLKALSTTLSQGTQTGNVFVPSNLPMTHFSNRGLLADATISKTITINNVVAAGVPFTMNLGFFDAPAFVTRDTIADSSGAANAVRLITNDGPGTEGQISHDGHYVYRGQRNTNKFMRFDLSTEDAATTELALTTAVTGAPASIAGVVLTADETKAYAAFNDGAHYQGSNGNNAQPATAASVQLVEIDVATNMELRRLEIVPAGDTTRAARHIVLSPDGKKAAILVSAARLTAQFSEVYFVDLTTFTVIDTDAAVTGATPVSLALATIATAKRYADSAVWDGDKLYIQHIQQHRTASAARAKVPIYVVNTTTFATSEMIPTTGANRACGMFVVNGKMYYCSGSKDNAFMGGITVFDLAAATQTQLYMGRANTMVVNPLSGRLYVNDFATKADMHVFDLATGTELDMDTDAANGVTPFTMDRANIGHDIRLTPF
jgi:hypothetical protein